jgi:hypothetical protein
MQMNVDKTKAEVQSSVIQTIRQLVRQEGISALYKGAQQNLLFFFLFFGNERTCGTVANMLALSSPKMKKVFCRER